MNGVRCAAALRRGARWRTICLALLLSCAATSLAAQRRPARPRPDPWLFKFMLYPGYDGLDRFSASFLGGWRRSPRRGPVPTTAAIEIAARVASSGTRTAQLAFDYPGLWPQWRLLAIAGADRLQRAPYHGIGNEPAGDSVSSTRYYRYSLRRYTAMVAVQRNLVPHLRLYAGTQLRLYRAMPLPGVDTTFLERDLLAGTVADTGSHTGAELRGGLLYDTRDEEASPSKGVFLEALIARGTTDLTYTRYGFGARQFFPLGEMTVLGLRQSVELADRAIPFYVMYERLTSWRPEDGFGGATTLRAHLPGRFLAHNRAIVSVDLRYKKIDVPIPTSPFRIWLVGFADAGRLWNSGEPAALRGLHWDAGVGGLVQLSKGSFFGLNVGVSRVDGFEFGTAYTLAF